MKVDCRTLLLAAALAAVGAQARAAEPSSESAAATAIAGAEQGAARIAVAPDCSNGQYPCCGDGECSENAGENCSSCQQDCGRCRNVCRDGFCDEGENSCTCAADCPGRCNKPGCEPEHGENCSNSPDCRCPPGGVCVGGTCTSCGDGICDAGENQYNCPSDCPPDRGGCHPGCHGGLRDCESNCDGGTCEWKGVCGGWKCFCP